MTLLILLLHTPAAANASVAGTTFFLLILIGLLITVVTEMYSVIKYFSWRKIKADITTVKAVVIMNISSYIVLTLVYGNTVIEQLLHWRPR